MMAFSADRELKVVRSKGEGESSSLQVSDFLPFLDPSIHCFLFYPSLLMCSQGLHRACAAHVLVMAEKSASVRKVKAAAAQKSEPRFEINFASETLIQMRFCFFETKPLKKTQQKELSLARPQPLPARQGRRAGRLSRGCGWSCAKPFLARKRTA